MKKFLIIQTSFIGDVILATPVAEKLARYFPDAHIDFLVRKGNESLFEGHPFIRRIWVWDKSRRKYANLVSLIPRIRAEKYDRIINLQRFFSTGWLTVLSGAHRTTGFDKNPLSFLFSDRIPHLIGDGGTTMHEVERNLQLIAAETDGERERPRLYPSAADINKTPVKGPYLTVSPASVWYTKQWPAGKWIAFLNRVPEEYQVFLLGGKSENGLCASIRRESTHRRITNLAGTLTFLESAALMRGAVMNYVNDSAPLHLASAVNAPVTAIFCSTVPAFGFTPLSDDSAVLETDHNLPCRPCGLHGKKACPEGHFRCSEIKVEKLLDRLR